MSIGTLLLLSGIISSLELTQFNNTTYDVLVRSQRNIELSKQMLDAIQEQNTALLLSITDSNSLYDSICKSSQKNFYETLNKARIATSNAANVESIAEAATNYNRVVSFLADSISIAGFSDLYKTSYSNLTLTIKNFMIDTQHQIVDFTSSLKEKAYRATMVAIISLGAGLFLMILFYYLLNIFYINPILRIKNSLKNYINSRIPFDVKINSKDEIGNLKEYISQLVMMTKNSENKGN